jgi:hypothetical protein
LSLVVDVLEEVLVVGAGADVELLVDEVDVELVVGLASVVDAPGGTVLDVLDVGGGVLVRVVLVVGRCSGGRVVDEEVVVVIVVVVLIAVAAGTGHVAGAGAFRAANFPGSSRRTSPPKTRQ